MVVNQKKIISDLKNQIMALEGFRPQGIASLPAGLGTILKSLPNESFPLGAIHEFHARSDEDSTACAGFVSALMNHIMGESGTALWISPSPRNIYPPALRSFGVDPERIIFTDVKREVDALWIMNEALKCGALKVVVGEMKNLPFVASRKLQLSVEEGQSTALIIRKLNKSNTTASVSRWNATSLPGEQIDNLPGLGYPTWKVDLLKIRNGHPGSWSVCFKNGQFEVGSLSNHGDASIDHKTRKAG